MHPRTSHFIIRTVSGLSVAGLMAVVSACAPSQAAQESSPGGTAGSSSVVINVGDQQQDLADPATASSRALKGASYKVNFVEFDSGPLVDAGLRRPPDRRRDHGRPARLAGGKVRHLPVVAVAVTARSARTVPAGQARHHVDLPAARQAGRLHHRHRGAGVRAAGAEAGRAHPEGRAPGQRQPAAARHGAAVGAADASVVSAEQKADYQQSHPGAKVLATIDSVSPPSYGYVLATTLGAGGPGEAGRHRGPHPAADQGPELGRSRTRPSGSPTTTSTSSTRLRRWRS